MASPGVVTTVTGEISVAELGITLTHEHLHMQFHVCAAPEPSSVLNFPRQPDKGIFQLKNLGVIRQYPYSVPYNLRLDDADSKAVMVDEINYFKALGGRSIVENTTHGISRNLQLLKQLSLATGVNIISGTGYYIAASQQPSVLTTRVEEATELMLAELSQGAEDGIKCGVIGEIGCSWPMHQFEKSVVQAAAAVQVATKKPVTFHPARSPESPFEIVRVFLEAGGKAEGAIMSHLDRTLYDDETTLEFAELGLFTQYDLFGTEVSHYQIAEESFMPSDEQRISKLRLLLDNGHLDQITVSHDIHTKHRLVSFGGHGYGHILQNVLPKMRQRGFTEEQLTAILVQNPRKWLSGLQ